MKYHNFLLVLAVLLAAILTGCGSDSQGAFQPGATGAGVAARLFFLNNPARTAGTVFGPIQVAVLDSGGQIVPTADNPITLELVNPNGAILSGTLTRNAVNGVATFDDISVDRVGQYLFTARSAGLDSATSAVPVTITPGTATQVNFTVHPSQVAVGNAITPSVVVEVRDALNNPVDAEVTLSLANNPGNAVLGGTLVRNAANGVATFGDLTVSKAGQGYSLRATVTGGANTASNPFNVTGGMVATGLLVADGLNNRLARFDDMTGLNWTTYGHGGNVFGVARDFQGRILFTDWSNHQLMRIDDLSGTGLTTLGNLGSGVNQFNNPYDLAVDSQGRILIADHYNHRIVRVNDISGAGWTELTYPNLGPVGVTVGPNDSIYVANFENNRIIRFDDFSGANPTELALDGPPYDVELDAQGRIYVTMVHQGMIRRFDDMQGNGLVTIGVGVLTNPTCLDISPSGEIFVSDHAHRMFRFDASGLNPTSFGSQGGGVGQFNYPYGVLVETANPPI